MKKRKEWNYTDEVIIELAKDLRRLGLEARKLASLIDTPKLKVLRHIESISPEHKEFSVIWKRFFLLLENLYRGRYSTLEVLEWELLSGYLDFDTLIRSVEQTLLTMHRLVTPVAPPGKAGYALLADSIVEREYLRLKSRDGLQPEVVRYILLWSPNHPGSLEAVEEVVCRAIGEKFRSQVLPALSNDVIANIQNVLQNNTLTSRELLVINGYFGLEDSGRRTLEAMARELRISPGRISQLKEKALNKLRSSPLRDLLESSLMNFDDMKKFIVSLQKKNDELAAREMNLRHFVEEIKKSVQASGGSLSQVTSADDPILSQSVEVLDLRCLERLKSEKVFLIRELVVCSESQLLMIPGFGRKQLQSIQGALKKYGLTLNMRLSSQKKEEITL